MHDQGRERWSDWLDRHSGRFFVLPAVLLILAFSIFLALSSLTPKEEKVFICKGGSAYAYHKTKNCRWLQNCTHTIEEVTLAEAKNDYKRKPCKPCYGLVPTFFQRQ